MENNIEFVRFADFLEKMLEKYGAEVMKEIFAEENSFHTDGLRENFND